MDFQSNLYNTTEPDQFTDYSRYEYVVDDSENVSLYEVPTKQNHCGIRQNESKGFEKPRKPVKEKQNVKSKPLSSTKTGQCPMPENYLQYNPHLMQGYPIPIQQFYTFQNPQKREENHRICHSSPRNSDKTYVNNDKEDEFIDPSLICSKLKNGNPLGSNIGYDKNSGYIIIDQSQDNNVNYRKNGFRKEEQKENIFIPNPNPGNYSQKFKPSEAIINSKIQVLPNNSHISRGQIVNENAMSVSTNSFGGSKKKYLKKDVRGVKTSNKSLLKEQNVNQNISQNINFNKSKIKSQNQAPNYGELYGQNVSKEESLNRIQIFNEKVCKELSMNKLQNKSQNKLQNKSQNKTQNKTQNTAQILKQNSQNIIPDIIQINSQNDGENANKKAAQNPYQKSESNIPLPVHCKVGEENAYMQNLGQINLSRSKKGGVQIAGKELIGMFLDRNNVCADCTAKNPTWLSSNIGCVVCTMCCSVHRGLGIEISRIRSLILDQISVNTISKAFGNDIVNEEFEFNVPSEYQKPNQATSMKERKKYIIAKYVKQIFRKRDGLRKWEPIIAPATNCEKKMDGSEGIISIHLKKCANKGKTAFYFEFSNGTDTQKSKAINSGNLKKYIDHLKLKVPLENPVIYIKLFSKGLLGKTLLGVGTMEVNKLPLDAQKRFYEGEDVTLYINFMGKGAWVTYNFQRIN